MDTWVLSLISFPIYKLVMVTSWLVQRIWWKYVSMQVYWIRTPPNYLTVRPHHLCRDHVSQESHFVRSPGARTSTYKCEREHNLFHYYVSCLGHGILVTNTGSLSSTILQGWASVRPRTCAQALWENLLGSLIKTPNCRIIPLKWDALCESHPSKNGGKFSFTFHPWMCVSKWKKARCYCNLSDSIGFIIDQKQKRHDDMIRLVMAANVYGKHRCLKVLSMHSPTWY